MIVINKPKNSLLNQIYKELKTSIPVIIDNAPNHIIVKSFLPGVEKNNINIKFENEYLVIRGSYTQDLISTDTIYSDINNNELIRNIHLGSDIKPDTFSSQLNNGVLIVRVEKSNKVKPQQIDIQ